MLKIFSGRKAQAMVEMAVLGPLLIAALASLVTYVCKTNNDQYALQQAFRYALAKSHTDNKIVGYGTWDDRRMADATNPILGKKTTSSGAAQIHWAIPSVEENDQGEGGADPEAALYIDINRFPEYDITQIGSGSVAPRYITVTDAKVSAGTGGGWRHGGSGEVMIYKIGDKMYVVQGRAHGR